MGVWYARGYSIGPTGLGESNGLNAFCAGDVFNIHPYFIPFRSEAGASEGVSGAYGK